MGSIYTLHKYGSHEKRDKSDNDDAYCCYFTETCFCDQIWCENDDKHFLRYTFFHTESHVYFCVFGIHLNL